MKNLKLFIASILILAAVLVVGASPVGVKAQQMTDAQIKTMIEQLQAQIMALMQQIAQLKGQITTPPAWCYTFDKNLRVGDVNKDISALQTIFGKENISIGDYSAAKDGNFTEGTASAVVEFQEKYASEILTPNGLKHGTGYVASATRKKLNALYGCRNVCTQEAKQCPDGSYVGRGGSNCEFAQCPKTQCTTDNDCPIASCLVGANCPLFKCVDGKCVSSDVPQVKESIKCVFNNNAKNTEQKCYTADEGQSRFSCSGAFSCVADVYGKKGEKLDWKSSCGNHAYTVIDGQDEYANFDCGQTSPFITVTSPNGGETYKVGDSITVNWKTVNVSSLQKFDVIRLRAYPNGQEYNLVSNTLNDGQEAITLPSSVPVGSYTLEIKSYIDNVLLFDASDSYFKIVSVASQCTSDADCPTVCPTCVSSWSITCGQCITSKCVEGKCIGLSTVCIPKWTCNWGPCINGYQSQVAVDSNNCGSSSAIADVACPALARACTCPTINCFVDSCPDKHSSDSNGCVNCSTPCR